MDHGGGRKRREGVRVNLDKSSRGLLDISEWMGRGGGVTEREMRSTARQRRVATVLLVAARVEEEGATGPSSPPSPSPCCAPTEEPVLSGMTCKGRKTERRGEGREKRRWGSKRVR